MEVNENRAKKHVNTEVSQHMLYRNRENITQFIDKRDF